MTARPAGVRAGTRAELADRLRASGCVFPEDELAALVAVSGDRDHLEERVARRVAGEPLEHVVGFVDFDGLRLGVGPGVFVPRQRSVHIARVARRTARSQRAPVLVEVCAGVAPIASSVARQLRGVEVHAADIDGRALGYAGRNLPVGAGVHQGHLLHALPDALRGRVSLLVATPPNVPTGQARLLPRDTLAHEPAHAFFSGADGLDHVRGLLDAAEPWLSPDATVLVEMHRTQYAAAAEHAHAAGYECGRDHSRDGQTTVLRARPAGT